MPPQSVQQQLHPQGPPAAYLQLLQGPLQHQPVLLTQSSFGSQQGHAGPMMQGSTQHTMLPTQQAPPPQPMDPTTYGDSTQTLTPNYMPTQPRHHSDHQQQHISPICSQRCQHPCHLFNFNSIHRHNFGHLPYNPPAQAHPNTINP